VIPIRAGERLIGTGQPCFLAAEIGINHNGDMELACRMIAAAAEAGADGVKFQNYRTEDFVSDRSLTYQYVSQGQTVTESQYDMFKRCELSAVSLRRLRDECVRHGLVFFSTPTSPEGVMELVELGAPLLKNGSDYLGNLPLITVMARTGIPTVISTGMAVADEISDAVREFRHAGGRDLILLHCTSAYPTPPEDVNLRRIPALAAAFHCHAGFSDHTEGVVAATGAVALGACFIEKHFTLDKNLPGPDHRFSSDPAEFSALVRAVRTLEKNLGNAVMVPTPSEEFGRREFRLSCAAARDLPAGHCISESDIAYRRPGIGLAPRDAHLITGKRLRHGVKAGKLLELCDVT